ncbi:MAG: type IV toxin-antitoxin system AbiEi family antitoxin domain-containing protein, partial [Acidimicrobiales bacterium]
MPTDLAIIDRLRPLGAIFRARDAIEQGISWRDLYQVRDSGLLIEVSRGLFRLREAAGIDRSTSWSCVPVP